MDKSRSNKFLILLVVVLALAAAAYFIWIRPQGLASSDPQLAALEALERNSETPLEVVVSNGFPIAVGMQVQVSGGDPVERAGNFMESYKDLYLQNDPSFDLVVGRVEDEFGESVLFSQRYKGIPVFAGEMSIGMYGDTMYSSGGNLLGELNISLVPVITRYDAEEIVMEAIGDPEARIIGQTSLVIFDESLINHDLPRDPHLAWMVTNGNIDSYRYFVDAHSAEVLIAIPLFAEGGGSLHGYALDIEDANGLNAADTHCYYWSDSEEDIGSENGLVSSHLNDPDSGAAWWAARNAYAFYHSTFNRHSWDNDETEIDIYVHANLIGPNTPNGNANWTGTSCEAIQFHTGWVAFDVMVHELTHAVIDDTSDLIYMNQSGALNESYADVMAAMADGNWTIGESCCGSGILRSMINPTVDRFSNFFMTGSDNGGVHTNSGITNKAAYLMTIGGYQNPWFITGIGKTKSGMLHYMTMKNLPSGASLQTNASAMISRATSWANNSIHGFTNDDACQVRNAFAAVELADGDLGCDGILDPGVTDNDQDFIIDSVDNCPNVKNTFQKDNDKDGQGDACDPDDDNDGDPDTNDNCQFVPNPNQSDVDNDGKGDLCDDEDGDGILDIHDNCPFVNNPNQVDTDNDGLGDGCDPDLDGDGVDDVDDNCPFVANADQVDTDGDMFGDACDKCPNDFDGVYAYSSLPNIGEEYGGLPQPYQPDSDGDGIPDACDDNLILIAIDDDSIRGLTDLKPDGSSYEVDVSGNPTDHILMPIPVCPPENNGRYSTDSRGMAVVEGLPGGIGVAVVNQYGDKLDRARGEEDMAYLLYRQRATEDYYMEFFFPMHYQGDETTPIRLSFSIICGLRGDLIVMMPERPEDADVTEPEEPEDSSGDQGDTTGATPTPEPDAAPPTATGLQNAACREGGDSAYPEVDFLLQDQTAPIVGISRDSNYYLITGPTWEIDCWVWKDLVETEGDLSTLPIVPYPPLPTPTFTPPPPTITPTPTRCPTGAANCP